MTIFKRAIWGTCASLVLVLAISERALANTTYTVNTSDDVSGTCAAQCSLRQALASAKLDSGPDTIVVPPGHYVLSLGELMVDSPVTLTGAGARDTVLDAAGASRVFLVQDSDSASTADVEIEKLTVTGGSDNGAGGLLNWEALALRDVAVTDNEATPGGGGGISNAGALTIERSTISGNRAAGHGGGILNVGSGVAGPLTITNSTITSNTANTAGSDGFGGGIHHTSNQLVTLVSTTIAGNSGSKGGGVLNLGPVSFESTIVAGNTATEADAPANCYDLGAETSAGHNIDSGDECNMHAAGDRVNTDPLLGPLQNNGGPTDTRALLAGSPAIDAGASSGCPATDQRGIVRPQGPACDIGAYEVAVPVIAPPPIAINPPATVPAALKPVLSRLRIAPRSFAAARHGGSIARRRRHTGALVRYRLSAPARVTFTVKSLKRGIRRGHRCVARTRRHHKGHPCTRKVRVRGSFAQRGKVGNNSLRFTGRLGHRRLRSGRYVLTATPRGATGRGKTRSASFRVLG